MKTRTILQIGDLHYNQADAGPDVDQKDQQVSDAMIATAAPSRLHAVMQAVQRQCGKDLPDVVAFCGDLTNRGCISVYKKCLDYLDRNLGLASGRYWSEDEIHAVPGNHDVDRSLADSDGKDFFTKFVPLSDAWREQAVDVLACDQVRGTTVGDDDAMIRALSLNSCVGCGERRARRGDFTSAVEADLKERAEKGESHAADLLWEGLDTPLFAEAHLNAVAEEIDDLDRSVLPVVTAHHNLLPQAVMRVDVYAELLNGGAARTRLSARDRWVVYLHGHIHTDPIEVIEQRFPDSGMVLSISAPEFKEGFNLIKVEFGVLGRPLGCVVRRFRYEPGGDVRPKKDIRVGLTSRREVTDPIVNDVLRCVAPGELLRFPNLLTRFGELEDRPVPERDQLADALREAEWVGHLSIGSRTDTPDHWTISRDVV